MTYWIVSILLSLGTAVSVFLISAGILDYFLDKSFGSGVFLGYLYFLGRPVMFVTSLVLWIIYTRDCRGLISIFKRWFVSLFLGVSVSILVAGIGSLILGRGSAFSMLIFLGCPVLSISTYGFVLSRLSRIDRSAAS